MSTHKPTDDHAAAAPQAKDPKAHKSEKEKLEALQKKNDELLLSYNASELAWLSSREPGRYHRYLELTDQLPEPEPVAKDAPPPAPAADTHDAPKAGKP